MKWKIPWKNYSMKEYSLKENSLKEYTLKEYSLNEYSITQTFHVDYNETNWNENQKYCTWNSSLGSHTTLAFKWASTYHLWDHPFRIYASRGCGRSNHSSRVNRVVHFAYFQLFLVPQAFSGPFDVLTQKMQEMPKCWHLMVLLAPTHFFIRRL